MCSRHRRIGFIGKQVVHALRGQADEIHAVQHTARQMSDSRNHTVDLMNAEQVDRLMGKVQPTHLIHLAWYAEHGKFWSSPLNLEWVAASLKLFQAFAEQGGERAVIAGTCAEYDWATSPLNEETSPNLPGTFYGVCKKFTAADHRKIRDSNLRQRRLGREFFFFMARVNIPIV